MKNILKTNLNTDYNLNVQVFSDKGRVRQNNEDSADFYIPDEPVIGLYGSLFVVSDGVGSNLAGEVASAEAVNVLLQEYYFGDHTDKVPERFKDCFNDTALHIYDLAEASKSCSKMMCTLTALLIKQNKFYITHVGDSKIFLLRDGNFIQLTKDHSAVAQMIRMGLITKEEAKNHPNKHVILRSLGDRPILPADFYSGNLLPNDIFFLSSDGIFEHFDEDEIRDFLIEKRHLKAGISRLVEIANLRGGYDNMTVMSIDTGV
jgi:serine/threonine protein phosphatase PrpC